MATLVCSQCAFQQEVPDRLIGKSSKCPSCGERADVTLTQREEVTRSAEHTKKAGILSLISVLLLFAILVVEVFPSLRSPSWEYRVESPGDSELQSKMDELGAEGWELVTARRATSGGGLFVSYEMIFKRRK